jgi:trigger factor
MTEAENNELLDSVDTSLDGDDVSSEEVTQETKEPLRLEVKVESPSSCQRHLTVSVSRDDVDRYLDGEYDDLLPKAEVPGFRPGKAPRRLVINRFKEHVQQQVKGKLLMDSLAQLSEEHQFSPISEPEIDLNAIEIPDEGPMTFEFSLEVRPEFDLPEWRGLTLEKPVLEITDAEVDQQLHNLLLKYGRVVERHGPAEAGDLVVFELEVNQGERFVSRSELLRAAVKPTLSLRDARFEDFGSLMTGVAAGDKRATQVTISSAVPDQALAGQTVQATFHVQKIERIELPHLSASFLDELGGFQDQTELREAVREALQRQHDHQAGQAIRHQITHTLTSTATWDLPPTLLQRQSQRELRRAVMELQSSGYTKEAIQAYANQLQQNILEHTSRALKEHFILERIAEEEKIQVEDADFDVEIARIAEQEGIPARRVKARLEKRGDLDTLRNQILENKVIEKIVAHATVIDTPAEKMLSQAPAPAETVAALDYSVSGRRDAESIPAAKYGEEPSKKLPS